MVQRLASPKPKPPPPPRPQSLSRADYVVGSGASSVDVVVPTPSPKDALEGSGLGMPLFSPRQRRAPLTPMQALKRRGYLTPREAEQMQYMRTLRQVASIGTPPRPVRHSFSHGKAAPADRHGGTDSCSDSGSGG